ncbi:von Willebrand factor type A domain protein [Calidithermus terrae]|uniref:von Willebrand factor type A domain protein n=1 Tax=Calidithermus terrae TaxID=1408545 RepID=A0A399EEG2_9DEIN|nr:VWA domain-containing protein [Calidithermus terrae]RIH82166.1 von Willebrand factor type A domain protein [Calidithermus terrae]
MGFLAPWVLLALLGLPLLVALYRRGVLGQSRAFAAYPEAQALLPAQAHNPGRLHLPAVLYLGAVALGLLALARPTLPLPAAENLAGVVLAIETGWSMRSTDIAPNRLEATQQAARALVEGLPASIPVGIAVFSSYGVPMLPLTLERQRVYEALQNLELGDGYSFTYGLLAALEALPDAAGEGRPGVIVLFSHGHDNSGNDPLEIAAEAARRGIRIHTIGVGTHGHNFDDDVLKQVADRSGGRYYPIFSAADLRDAHRDLGRVIAVRPRPTEVSALFSLAAASLLGLSLGVAFARRRVV